jgi:hypothetical protein
MAKTTGIDAEILAEQYGFAASVLNSNPELKRLFQKAVGNHWDQQTFTARLYNTHWYKTHGETYRNALVQKKVDPATYKQKVYQQRNRVSQAAAQMGARMSGKTRDRLGELAYQLGWDDNQLRAHLANYIKFTKGDAYGQAGQDLNALREYAGAMGVGVSGHTMDHWVKLAAAGRIDINDAKNRIKELAVSKYPAVAHRLLQGETIDQIADPYKQAMGELLEIDPAAIGNRDKTVQMALSMTDLKGNHALMPLHEFEDKLRADPRWRTTNNAQDAVSTQIHQLGVMFGKVS